MGWKRFEGKPCCITLDAILSNLPRGTEENYENLGQDSRRFASDLNQTLPIKAI
jgi:hypothetical protein